jgi:hypothetical protein
LDWVLEAWKCIEKQSDLIKKSFRVTGLAGEGDVRADGILKAAMEKAMEQIEKEYRQDLED